MENILTASGKRLLKLGISTTSLEHQDRSLNATNNIPLQYVDDEGSHIGDNVELHLNPESDDQFDERVNQFLNNFNSKTI